MADKRIYQLERASDPTDAMAIPIDDAGFSETQYISWATIKSFILTAFGVNYVPYRGATNSIDLGTETITAGGAVFGTATDNATFEADGTLILNGAATVFRDEKNDVLNLKVAGTGVSINPTESTADFSSASDLSDYLYVNVQMNHDRKLTSAIYPHIHYFTASANVPNFLLEYRWQINGGRKATSWTRLKCNTKAFTYVSGTINQIAVSAAIAAPSGDDVDNISDIVQFRIYRDNANTSGLFTGSDAADSVVSVISFDIHIEIDSMGSREEYVN